MSLLDNYLESLLETREKHNRAEGLYKEGKQLVRSSPTQAVIKLYEAGELGHKKARKLFFGTTLSSFPKITTKLGKSIPQDLTAEEMFQLGLQAVSGIGMRKNKKLAYACFLKASVKGYTPAHVHYADMVYNTAKVKDQSVCGAVRKQLSLAAEEDNTEALQRLGYISYYGYGGVAPDKDEALEYFRRAAEAGDQQGQLWMYKLKVNSPIKTDKRDAIKWLRLAAIHGGEAKSELEYLYSCDKIPQETDKSRNASIYRFDLIMGIPNALFILGERAHENSLEKDFILNYHYVMSLHTHESSWDKQDKNTLSHKLYALINQDIGGFFSALIDDFEARKYISKEVFNSFIVKLYPFRNDLSDDQRNELYFRLADAGYTELSITIKDKRQRYGEVEHIMKLFQEIPEGHARYEESQLPLEHCRYLLEGASEWERGIALESDRRKNVQKFTGLESLHSAHEYSQMNVGNLQARIKLEKILARAKTIAENLPVKNKKSGASAHILKEIDRVYERWLNEDITLEEILLEVLAPESVLSNANLDLLSEITNTLNKASKITDYLSRKFIENEKGKAAEIELVNQNIKKALEDKDVDFNMINASYLEAKGETSVLSDENMQLQLKVLATLQKAEEIAQRLNRKTVWNGREKANNINCALNPLRSALKKDNVSTEDLNTLYSSATKELRKALDWHRYQYPRWLFSVHTDTRSTKVMDRADPNFTMPKKSG